MVFVDGEGQVAFFVWLAADGERAAGVHVTVAGVVGEEFQAVFFLDIAGGDFQGVTGWSLWCDWVQYEFVGGVFYDHAGEEAIVVVEDGSVLVG